VTERPARAIGAVAGIALACTSGLARADAPDVEAGARALASPFAPGAPTARADEAARTCGEEPAQPEFALDVSAIAMLPLTVGGRIAMEVPGHFVLYVNAGLLPVAIIDGINDVGTGWGLWSQTDAQIARTMLGDATWFEVGLGLRPSGTPGIEISAGYALLWTHRLSTLGAMAPGASALVGPSDSDVIGIDVTIDTIHAELAWQTEIFDGVSFRAALGWIHAFRHSVAIVTESRDELVVTAMQALGAALEREIGSRAFGPTLSFSLGVHLD
jgi:hypothetical protein